MRRIHKEREVILTNKRKKLLYTEQIMRVEIYQILQVVHRNFKKNIHRKEKERMASEEEDELLI